MFNKKLMILAIFFVSLLAVSAVSAADNVTDDVVSVEEATDEVVSISYNTTDDVGSEDGTNDNDKLNNFDEDIISYESNNNSLKVIEFDNISSDSNNNLICADNKGICIKVPSRIYYGDWNAEITIDFNMEFTGYLKIYKSGALVESEKIEECHSWWYRTGDLNVGSYEAKIVSSTGDVLASSAFKILKAPTRISYSVYKDGSKYVFCAWMSNKLSSICLEKGTVKFKINGKTYNVKLRDTDATLKIKMPKKSKTKTYKCTATFGGDKNHKGCKITFKVKVKATKVKKTNKKKAKSKKKTTKKTKIQKKKTKSKVSIHRIKAGKYKGKLSNKQYKKLKNYYKKDKNYAGVTIKSSNYKYCKIRIEYLHGVNAMNGKYYKKGFYASVWDTRYGMDGTKFSNKKISIK